MALIQYGNKNVDDKFSALVEPNLFGGSVFQPGVSFTDKYQTGPAGQILVHKPGIATITPTSPGTDFTDVDVADSVITISLDQAFQRSRKLYGAQAAAVAYDAAATELELAVREVREGWNLYAMETLLDPAATAAVSTAAYTNIYDDIVENRQKLVEQKAEPTTIIVSPEVYSDLLKTDEFQRTGTIGDNTVANGVVGRIAGMDVIEYNIFASAYSSGDTVAGTVLDANDKVHYAMYDLDAYSIVTSLDMMRIKDSERFNGSLAQVEIVSGFKVTNTGRVLARVEVVA